MSRPGNAQRTGFARGLGLTGPALSRQPRRVEGNTKSDGSPDPAGPFAVCRARPALFGAPQPCPIERPWSSDGPMHLRDVRKHVPPKNVHPHILGGPGSCPAQDFHTSLLAPAPDESWVSNCPKGIRNLRVRQERRPPKTGAWADPSTTARNARSAPTSTSPCNTVVDEFCPPSCPVPPQPAPTTPWLCSSFRHLASGGIDPRANQLT